MTLSAINSDNRVFPTINPVEILLLPVEAPDSGADTFARYLNSLTQRVFDEAGDFNPIFPFSTQEDAEYPLIHALVLHDIIDGAIDLQGYVEDYHQQQFFYVLAKVFEYLNNADYSTLTLPPEPKDHALIQFGPSSIDPDTEIVVGYHSSLMSEKDAELWLETEAPQTKANFWLSVKVK